MSESQPPKKPYFPWYTLPWLLAVCFGMFLPFIISERKGGGSNTEPVWAITIVISAALLGYIGIAFFRYLEAPKIEIENQDPPFGFRKVISEEERSNIVQGLRADLFQELKQSAILEEIKGLLDKKLEEDDLKLQLRETIRRLSLENTSLQRRSNINLFIGILLGVAGLGIIATAAYQFGEAKTGGDLKDFAIRSIPRISLGILTEFLAYFFLRLYKDSAIEARYYHNEITNQECRYSALLLAWRSKSESNIARALEQFVQTERNGVLNAGQSTHGLELSKLSSADNQALQAFLQDALKLAKENKSAG